MFGPAAFFVANVADVVIGAGVTNIGDSAFASCLNLTHVCFRSNAPAIGGSVFYSPIYTGRNPTAYYPPSSTGWGTTFGGLPTALWDPVSKCVLTNVNNALTITGYIGSSNNVTVPDSVSGLPVKRIGTSAFSQNTTLTNVTLSANVTNVGSTAFSGCTSLGTVQMPGVTVIGFEALQNCSKLQNVVFSPNLISIGQGSFINCGSLRSLDIPPSTTEVYLTFSGCTNLASLFFHGNAPSFVVSPFLNDTNLTVQSCTVTNGSIYFGDPLWTNFPVRFYRIRSP